MLEAPSKSTPAIDIERILALKKELEELQAGGEAGAQAELDKTLDQIDALLSRAELIALTFKLDFTLKRVNSYPSIRFYGEPQNTYDSAKTGWLSSSSFC